MHDLPFTQTQPANATHMIDWINVIAVGGDRHPIADAHPSHGWTCRVDRGLGQPARGATNKKSFVSKPRTRGALQIKSEGDSKTRSETRTQNRTQASARTWNRTSVRSV